MYVNTVRNRYRQIIRMIDRYIDKQIDRQYTLINNNAVIDTQTDNKDKSQTDTLNRQKKEK